MKPAEERALAGIRAELNRVIRYDDESIVNRVWVMQRYDCGCFPGLAKARQATVETAWHEAGHAVAALAVGARFSSASIRHACGQEGRVHGVSGAADRAFVIDAAGQIAERLRNWTMLEHDDELRAWLPTWKSDGSDALIDALVAHGSGEQVAAQLAEHFDAGADHVAVQLLTAPEADVIDGYRQLAQALHL